MESYDTMPGSKVVASMFRPRGRPKYLYIKKKKKRRGSNDKWCMMVCNDTMPSSNGASNIFVLDISNDIYAIFFEISRFFDIHASFYRRFALFFFVLYRYVFCACRFCDFCVLLFVVVSIVSIQILA